jgi:hypothetical protein
MVGMGAGAGVAHGPALKVEFIALLDIQKQAFGSNMQV